MARQERRPGCPAQLATRGFSYAMIGVFAVTLAWIIGHSAMLLAGT